MIDPAALQMVLGVADVFVRRRASPLTRQADGGNIAGLSSVLTGAYGYAPEKMRAAVLDLRRAEGAQGDGKLDLSAVESFKRADRTFVTIEKMHHSDFTSFAMIGARFHTPISTTAPLNGWNRETGRAGHEQVCRIVLAFLDDTVRHDSSAAGALMAAVGRAAGGVLRREAALPPPPSPPEAADLARREGLEAVTAVGAGWPYDQERRGGERRRMTARRQPAYQRTTINAVPRSQTATRSTIDVRPGLGGASPPQSWKPKCR